MTPPRGPGREIGANSATQRMWISRLHESAGLKNHGNRPPVKGAHGTHRPNVELEKVTPRDQGAPRPCGIRREEGPGCRQWKGNTRPGGTARYSETSPHGPLSGLNQEISTRHAGGGPIFQSASLMRRGLFRRAPGRIRFFNFVTNGMKIVRGRDHGEQQHHEATQENNGAETTRMPETSRAN